jgi:pyruvate dehydrogenase E2 component (dihydrolipoamide acetyltransferase)
MPIELKMPALSPTMEEGTLAKWLVKVGDSVSSGDLLAEIETDKATMEFEAVDEGIVTEILVSEGTDGVKVGTIIAIISGDDEDVSAPKASVAAAPAVVAPAESAITATPVLTTPVKDTVSKTGNRILASPLAKRIAADNGIDLSTVKGTGPNGRIVKADVEGTSSSLLSTAVVEAANVAAAAPSTAPASAAPTSAAADDNIPHTIEKLSNMRKTIARRLTESKQQVPHIYLTVDIRLDALLKLRAELNAALEPQGVKLSVNDLLIKALAKSLMAVPKCNVAFAGNELINYHRADISVAVSMPGGLITPIIQGADGKAVSAISTEMKELAGRAKEGKLQPHEYVGGTASLSNMGMFGIKQFEAVINPPQAMIMAIGAGEKRPYIVEDALAVATVMSATGSFDHRAIDGADGAQLMKAFKELVEKPLGLVA